MWLRTKNLESYSNYKISHKNLLILAKPAEINYV